MTTAKPEIGSDEALFASRAPSLILGAPHGPIRFSNGEYRTTNPDDIRFLLDIVRDSERLGSVWVRHLPDTLPQPLPVPIPPIGTAPCELTPTPAVDDAAQAAARQERFERTGMVSSLDAWSNRANAAMQSWQREHDACQANIARALAALDQPMASLVAARTGWVQEAQVLRELHAQLATQAAKHGITVPALTIKLPDER